MPFIFFLNGFGALLSRPPKLSMGWQFGLILHFKTLSQILDMKINLARCCQGLCKPLKTLTLCFIGTRNDRIVRGMKNVRRLEKKIVIFLIISLRYEG